MHTRNRTTIAALACALAGTLGTACSSAPKTDTPPPADSAAAAAPMAGMDHDADKSTGGAGVPAGYMGRTDNAAKNIADAKYVDSNGRWDITTGPAHIVYAAKDSASGAYTATTTIDQLAAPSHPEAYGLVIGGTDLAGAGQRYTYFIVRGTGEYSVKVRDGAAARTLVDFTANPAVPKADAGGKASYALGAQVMTDSVKFMVNGTTVKSLPKAGLFTDGVVGVRVNHNLRVLVTPVQIKK
jgi:hypothetical protein